MTDLASYMAEASALVEAKLASILVSDDPDDALLHRAMAYSALGTGKRIRPFLTLAVSDLFGGERAKAVTLGTALEMIHTYSLIHDDLPCMDDDDLRRGRPTCHVAFGESTALLAGDGLLTCAFETVACDPALSPAEIAGAVKILSQAAGRKGMIAGQIMDLTAEKEPIDAREKLEKLQGLKTGRMIRAAVRLGALAGRQEDPVLLDKLDAYADRLGLAFQIVDDWLDVCGDTSVLGKPVGSDALAGKTTFVTLVEPRQAMAYAAALTDEACDAVAQMDRSGCLRDLAQMLLHRKK